MSVSAFVALGLLLGARHAMDADHLVAVSTIVTRESSVRGAASVGLLWGMGHSLTILLVGATMMGLSWTISDRTEALLELPVAVMLIWLGVRSLLRGRHLSAAPRVEEGPEPAQTGRHAQPVLVGVIHGVGGSAAVALLVVPLVESWTAGVAYLILFGAGTVLGMTLVTVAFARPLGAEGRFGVLPRRALIRGAGALSIGLGVLLGIELVALL